MKQVVQAVNGGPVRVLDVPRPTIGATEVLVRTVATTISPGTERAVTELARASLLEKARARPDLVRQVVRKVQTDGLVSTARVVRSRLDEDMPLGYSGAGFAVEVGEAVKGVVPGQLVATGGASKANHAEFQAVSGLLCVPVPDRVSPSDAAMATIASIALHGLRLADVEAGSKIVVVGLGLIGQLAARLAMASGCDAYGIDLEELAVDRVVDKGGAGSVEAGEGTTKSVRAWTRDRGADAVIVAAAGQSSSVMQRVPELCRDRASIVVVGDVGLDLDRRPYYERELSVRFARSYGPGRYDRSYEEWGIDYPVGQVPFTEGRNIETVLDLLNAGRLEVGDLVTHAFPVSEAVAAYDLIEKRREHVLGVQLEYPGSGGSVASEAPISVGRPKVAESPGLGLIGAGAFASTVLLPAMNKAGFSRLVAVASASGLSARHLAERAGFERAVSGPDAVIEDKDVDVVVIATPHDMHASLTVKALRAGKHVFCEKPLALTLEELEDIEESFAASAGVLFTGFNRRWSEPALMVREHFGEDGSPLVITYRVSAGLLPVDHWYHDRRQGGRLLGEVCHFIDTCAAIVGEDAIDIHAAGGGSRGELLLAQDLALVLRYPSGSVAAITYAADGHPSVEKERLEVLGRGRSALVSDFHEVVLDGRSVSLRLKDKGHQSEASRFIDAVRSGEQPTGADGIASTRTALFAAASLGARSRQARVPSDQTPSEGSPDLR